MPAAPQGTLDHHFLEGRQYRADEIGEFGLIGRWWRRAFFLSCGLSLLLVLGLIRVSTLPHQVPYYIKEEPGGMVRPLGPAPLDYTPSQLTIRLWLREFIETLRGISEDSELMRRQWNVITRPRLSKKGQQLFVQYEATWKPLEQREPTLIEVLQFFERTPKTWEVRWQETHYNTKRELVSLTTYRGQFTFEQRKPRSQEELDYNPAGIFFDTWQWSKE